MIYWELFLGFLRVGCFAFGGAYGAIPLIREIVLANGWLTDEAVTNMIAISESTPGPIMVNMATYVGSSQAGALGAVVATVAVVLPAFLVILAVMVALKAALKNPLVQAFLRGVKPCIIGIIFATGIHLILGNSLMGGNVRDIALTGLLAAILFLWKPITRKDLSPITFIALAALLGMIFLGNQ